MQKIVISKNNWGLLLSKEAIEMYMKLIGKDCFFYDIDFGSYKQLVHRTFTPTDYSYVFTKEVPDNIEYNSEDPDLVFPIEELKRDDKNLVKVIAELGDKAGYQYDSFNKIEFKIIEIPDDVTWYINECIDPHDGEYICEYMRTWS